MIKKIEQLKNIRGFLDFSNPSEEFHKKNIIYAPNGTGKTNISRVFNKLSKNEPLDELLSQEASSVNELDFKIKYAGNEVTKANFSSHKTSFENIYVFNSDYIENTIRSKNFSEIDVSGEVKIPIGEKSNTIVELEKSIASSKKTRTNTEDRLLVGIDNFKKLKLKSKNFKLKDQNIWKELNLANILNDDFSLTLPVNEKTFIDCEIKFKEISKIDENTAIDFSTLNEINFDGVNLKDLRNDLSTPKNFKVFDQKVKENIENLTKDWIATSFIKKGVELSKEKDVCLLCERKLDETVNTLFNKYQTYFENEESKFKDKLTNYSKDVEALKKQILKINNNLQNDVNSYAKLFDITKSWKTLDTIDIVKKIEELETAIQDKRNNTLGSFYVLDKNGAKFDFTKAIEGLNKEIKENLKLVNSVIDKFSKVKEEKTKLRTIIGKKFLFEFYTSNKTDFETIISENNNIINDNTKLLKEQESLPKTSVSSNIEMLCNIFLKDYLYIDKYRVEDKNGLITLKLQDKDISRATQKISEGEKTMISLAFYLASSIQKFNSSNKFFNAIFIIDDPVNSTSYNYFFGVCNLLKFFDETIVNKLWNDEKNKLCSSRLQKIIFSHNTQFFNVIRENVFKGYNDKFFILTNKSLNFISRKRLKSDFEDALYKIKKSIEMQDYQTSVGNELRRFFETIKHFYGIKDFNADTLAQIFKGFEEKKHHIFYTVINYYSHSNPEAHTDPLPINFEPFLKQFDELINNSLFKELWNNIKLD